MNVDDLLYETMGGILGKLIEDPTLTQYTYTGYDDNDEEVEITIDITPELRKDIADWCLVNLPEMFNY